MWKTNGDSCGKTIKGVRDVLSFVTKEPIMKHRKTGSYATAVTSSSYSTSILPPMSNPVTFQKHGDILGIKINGNAFKERLEMCKFSLIARVFMSKRDKLWLLQDLILKLQTVWNTHNLCLISIGQDYYQVLLTSKEDKGRIWA